MVSSEAQDPAAAQKMSLDDYYLQEYLGQGAYGQVQHAQEVKGGRDVAIKIVSIATITRFNKEKHVFREKALLNELHHPNIIELYATFKQDESLYFVMEHAPNGDLETLVR